MSAHRPYDLAIATLLGPVVIARSALCAGMLIGIALLSYRVTVASLDPRLASAAALIVPVALVAWSLWSPASSGFRMWIVETMMVLTLAVSAYAVVVVVVNLWMAEFALGPWLTTAWSTLLLIPAMWLIRRGIDLRIGRSAEAVAARRGGAGVSAARPFDTLAILPLALAGPLSAAVEPTASIALQPVTVLQARQAGIGGTGCWWRARGEDRWRLAMSGRVAVARTAGRIIVLRPATGARHMFPFTFDRWQTGDTRIRVVSAPAAQQTGSETLDASAQLLVTTDGVSARYAGTMRCGS